MGKLKEKKLNNLSEQEMEDMFGISAFEYVELMAKYKDDENYIPTEAEIEDIENMVEQYYQSKEFEEYLDTLNLDEVLAEHNQSEFDEINDSLARTFTEDEIIEAIRSCKNEDWFIERISRELNSIWNRKNGYE
jgi:aminoglycoside phosphotransferase family enzyme